MVVLKRRIIIDSREVEVPVFQKTIKPGKSISEDVIDEIQKEERIEKEIQTIVEKIKIIANRYTILEKNLDYFYQVGKILHFIDKKGYLKMKGRIWQRIAHDLEPRLLLANTQIKKEGSSPQKESKRNIEDMYQLAKYPKKFLHRASWNQWDEIVKFTNIQANKKLITAIFKECKNGASGKTLRNRIKELRDNYS